MSEQETENAIKLYLETDKYALSTLSEENVAAWYYGRACYAERCKALLKSALEAE